jgi:glycosyltransferase involved in cell wall biosynthesis
MADADTWRAIGPLVRLLCDGGVQCLAAGVPRGHTAELSSWTEARRLRALTGTLGDGEISVVARCADVFVVPWTLAPRAPAADALARLALAASGVPVVASDEASNVLVHERNAFLVRGGDIAGYRATIARLLELPARQRHYMGAEFAAWTLRCWPVDAAVETYDARLAAMAGRVEIPFELRAAA